MITKTCPKCNEEKNTRGFHLHLKACKGTLDNKELPKLEVISDTKKDTKATIIRKHVEPPNELPGLMATFGIMNALQEEVRKNKELLDNKQIEMEESSECTCMKFRNEVYKCPIHEANMECPRCHCVRTSSKVLFGYMEPCQMYRCSMCNNTFQKNLVSGEFI